jgi:hypothetical protein
MVIEILAADTRSTVSICIVSPTHNTSIRNIGRKEVAEPVHAVFGSPGLFSMSVQAVDSYYAGR